MYVIEPSIRLHGATFLGGETLRNVEMMLCSAMQSFGLAVHCKRARRGLQGGKLAEVLVETYAQWLRKVVSHWVARSLRTLNDARNWPSFLKTAA